MRPPRAGGRWPSITPILLLILAACEDRVGGVDPIVSLAINETSPATVVGGMVQLSITGTRESGAAVLPSEVAWATGDESVAAVSGTGLVRGVGLGTTSVDATSDGVTASVALRVLPTESDERVASLAPNVEGARASVARVVSLYGEAQLGEPIRTPSGTGTFGAMAVNAEGHILLVAPQGSSELSPGATALWLASSAVAGDLLGLEPAAVPGMVQATASFGTLAELITASANRGEAFAADAAVMDAAEAVVVELLQSVASPLPVSPVRGVGPVWIHDKSASGTLLELENRSLIHWDYSVAAPGQRVPARGDVEATRLFEALLRNWVRLDAPGINGEMLVVLQPDQEKSNERVIIQDVVEVVLAAVGLGVALGPRGEVAARVIDRLPGITECVFVADEAIDPVSEVFLCTLQWLVNPDHVASVADALSAELGLAEAVTTTVLAAAIDALFPGRRFVKLLLLVAAKAPFYIDLATWSGTLDEIRVCQTDNVFVDCVEPLSIVTGSLAEGVVGVAYADQLTAVGGDGMYTWTVVGGALPTGLSLDRESGSLSGTPTAAGVSEFAVAVASGDGQAANASLSISIRDRLIIETTALPDGYEGAPYDQTLGATGGDGGLSWEITEGRLPDGLALEPTTGRITGTPSAPGTFDFVVSVVSADLQRATQPLSIDILEPDSGEALAGEWVGTFGRRPDTCCLDMTMVVSPDGSGAIVTIGVNEWRFSSITVFGDQVELRADLTRLPDCRLDVRGTLRPDGTSLTGDFDERGSSCRDINWSFELSRR